MENKLTRYELNKALAKLLGQFGPCYADVEKNRIIDGVLRGYDDDTRLTHPDYCGNWNDLMPLVVKYGNRMDWQYHWTMTSYPPDLFYDMYINENPQRALVECLYKVLQAKAEKE